MGNPVFIGFVTPAKAGAHSAQFMPHKCTLRAAARGLWAPAFAGVTVWLALRAAVTA